MDVGTTNGWRLEDVVSAGDIVGAINAELPLVPVDPNYKGEVARRYRYCDGVGEIGIISSVTQPFCGDCTRVRLSSEGLLYTCLFGALGRDLRAPLRDGVSDQEISDIVAKVWRRRSDRYSEIRTEQTSHRPKVEMSHIGG
jgi:cyclic pyranopterin phosphate synthase